jgi:hypothetical protein
MINCKQCNRDFRAEYISKYGYIVTKDSALFCGKSCATKYQRGSLTKAMIEDEIIAFITSKNRYCNRNEILKGIARSPKTLVKFKISIKSIQKSIGFIKSKSLFEEQIYTYLKKLFCNIECEKTFGDLLSPKGFKLRVDFYIKEFNLIIEADGTQHNDKNNPRYNSYYKKCDLLKNEYAKLHNINIVRIPYSRTVTDDYIKPYLSEFI